MSAYNSEKIIFDTLAGNMQHSDRTIVVDGGSMDGTCSEVARFNESYSANVRLEKMKNYSRRIGALKKGVEALTAEGTEYALLLDDDTLLMNSHEGILRACEKIRDKGYSAATFRRIPRNNSSIVEKMQAMEFNTVNAMNLFLNGAKKQRNLRGEGGLYEINALLEALDLHSGSWDGEDHELTCILQENGNKSTYFNDIIIKPTVPETLSKRIMQSRRWERGAIKTNIKKRDYLAKNMSGLNRLSLVQAAEMCNYLTFGAAQAAFGVAANIYYLLSDGKKEDALLLPLFPIYTMGDNILSKSLALYDIAKDGIAEETAKAKAGFSKSSLAE